MEADIDTIAAIATAPGEAGIAIVRLSGSASIAIADRVLSGCDPVPSAHAGGTFFRAFVVNPKAVVKGDIDEVIVLLYRAPNSYTREDVVEIQGHGGRTCARRILQAVLDAGARLAAPGEFTKRAFLNGRIDLLQAEAVADLIAARSQRAAMAAIDQLEGSLSAVMTRTYDDIIHIAADIEATLDFEEGELPAATMDNLVAAVSDVVGAIGNILDTWEEGHLLREGALVVLCGKPNVGKSTLLNRLIGSDRAIVTDVPGTTRDTIEEQVIIEGIPVRLVDTAGIRTTDCMIEQEGVERAQAIMRKADVIVYMLDGSVALQETDLETLGSFGSDRCMVVINKADLGLAVDPVALQPYRTVTCSLLANNDVKTLRAEIAAKMGVASDIPPHAVISERHRSVLAVVKENLEEAEAILRKESTDVVIAADLLREALERLGTVTGRTYTAELLDNIFSRFCVGK